MAKNTMIKQYALTRIRLFARRGLGADDAEDCAAAAATCATVFS